jgi:signal transduction histidine kinase
MVSPTDLKTRVVIVAPIGRDAELLAATASQLNVTTVIASGVEEIIRVLQEGAGCLIIAEEALTPHAVEALRAWSMAQPVWSDLPFVVLISSGRPTHESRRRAQDLQVLGNVTFVERPVRPETMESYIRAGLRARMRQYEVRSRQEALLAANADLEQFAYSASHDLTEPLRTISLFADLLARRSAGALDATSREQLALIRANAKRLNELLADLMEYAHVSSLSDQTAAAVDAMRPLKSALDALAVAIEESGAKISVGELPFVRIHESHLSQLFQNLIGNAIKYRCDGRPVKIDVSAQSSDGMRVFRVADNGIGVPPEYHESIFKLFKRLHTHATHSGSGMGLAICKRILERYQGRIWVESEPGEGSSFFFAIPQ